MRIGTVVFSVLVDNLNARVAMHQWVSPLTLSLRRLILPSHASTAATLAQVCPTGNGVAATPHRVSAVGVASRGTRDLVVRVLCEETPAADRDRDEEAKEKANTRP